MPLQFTAGVDQSVRDALTADPNFVHPDFTDRPAWVLRSGSPRRTRIVGATRRGSFDHTIIGFDTLTEGEHVVIHNHPTEIFWTAADAALANAEIAHP